MTQNFQNIFMDFINDYNRTEIFGYFKNRILSMTRKYGKNWFTENSDIFFRPVLVFLNRSASLYGIKYMLYRINIEILENGESSLILFVPNSIHSGLYWFTVLTKTHLSSAKGHSVGFFEILRIFMVPRVWWSIYF